MGTKRRQSLSDLDVFEGVPLNLQRNSIFTGLPEKVIEKIISKLVLRVYQTGDVIIYQGDIGHSLFILLSGCLSVYSETSECILSTMHPGSIFGEIGVLFDCQRTATVRVTSHICKIAVLNRQALEDALSMDEEGVLLKKLRERARVHLDRDSERLPEPGTLTSICLQDMKVFDDYPIWKQDTLRLFLSDCKAFKIPKGQKVLLTLGSVYMLVKGEGKLVAVMGEQQDASPGFIFGIDDEFDFFRPETACMLLSVPRDVYSSFEKGVVIDYGQSPKRARHGEKLKLVNDYSDENIKELDKSVQELKLDGCWMITDEAIKHVCMHLIRLVELSLADCWNLTEDSLIKLSELNELKRLNLSNLNGVTNKVVKELPRGIEVLNISYCSGIEDLGWLQNLPHLKYVEAKRTSFKQISFPLPSSVEYVDISECSQLTDNDFSLLLQGCSLKSLSLSSSTSLSASVISIFSKMENLEELNISNCNFVNDVFLLSLVNQLSKLRYLDISYCSNVKCLFEIMKTHSSIKIKYHHCKGLDFRQRNLISLLS